jgi:enhancer of polycomb-like protein
VQENRDREIGKEIQNNIEKHINWNKGYVDKTRAPLSPPQSDKNFADREKEFRKAMPVQIPLPTPPASVSDGEGENIEMLDGEPRDTKPPVELSSIRYSSPDPSALPAPSFRTRVGRGGRIVLDRRLPFRKMEHHPFQKLGCNKFDSDDEDADNIESDDDPDHESDRRMIQRQFLFGKAQQNMNPARQIEGPAGLHRSPSSQVNGMQQPAGA